MACLSQVEQDSIQENMQKKKMERGRYRAAVSQRTNPPVSSNPLPLGAADTSLHPRLFLQVASYLRQKQRSSLLESEGKRTLPTCPLLVLQRAWVPSLSLPGIEQVGVWRRAADPQV